MRPRSRRLLDWEGSIVRDPTKRRVSARPGGMTRRQTARIYGRRAYLQDLAQAGAFSERPCCQVDQLDDRRLDTPVELEQAFARVGSHDTSVAVRD